MPCRLSDLEPVLRWEEVGGLVVTALSESEEDADLGGEGSLCGFETLL